MKPLTYKLFFDETAEDDADAFGDKYWDSGYGAAGCIFIAKDTGRILLAHRSNRVDYEPHTWATWGGKVDEGETPKDAVIREVEEETGYDGEYKVTPLWTFEDAAEGFKYYNFLVVVPNEFHPQLNWENDDSKWVEWGDWPRPMHFGLVELFRHSGPTLKRIIQLIKRRQSDILETVLPKAVLARENTKPVVIGNLGSFTPSPRVTYRKQNTKPKQAIQEMMNAQNENAAVVSRRGIVGQGVYEYELRSPFSIIRYRMAPASRVFYLDNIATPNEEHQGKGYAKAILESFFQLVKRYGGSLDCNTYTTSGMAYIKHVIERLATQYGVPLLQGSGEEEDD